MIKPRRRRLAPGFWPAIVQQRSKFRAPVVLAFAAALIAAVIMPQQAPFPYQFEKGLRWNYSTLKAPFDFDVLYPEAQVRTQIDRINAEHAPYYVLRQEVARQQKQQFANLVKEQTRVGRNDTQFEDMVRNQGAYISFGQQLLDVIYDRGVGGSELEALRQEHPEASIFLVSGKTEQRRLAADFYSLKSAQDFLTDTLPYCPLRQPEMLLPILEKSLAPNVLYSDSLTTAGKRQKIAAVVTTGITVRKGDIIVQKNETVTEDVYLKLSSLSSRFDAPPGTQVMAGYALLALLAFGLYFFWLQLEHEALWQNWQSLLLPPVLALFAILLVALGCWIGSAVALLIPVWGMLLMLNRTHGPGIARMTWALTVLLTAFSLDWSAAWMALQLAGAAGIQLLHQRAAAWPEKVKAALITAVFQVLVWSACLLASKMPAGLQTVDVIPILLIANGLTLIDEPIRRVWLAIRTNRTSPKA